MGAGSDERLLQYLRTIPSLASFVHEFKAFKRSKLEFNRDEHWVIGQGFKPAQENRLDDDDYQTTTVEIAISFAISAREPVSVRRAFEG